MDFSIKEVFSASIVLFAVLDILGALPIVLSLEQRGQKVNPGQTSIVAFLILFAFMFVGEALLGVFGVDLNSFAVAGSIVLFVIGLEMLLGAEFFKNEGTVSASVVPLAFPLLAGPGSFTTILSLRAEFDSINVVIALFLNIVFVYAVLRASGRIHKLLGDSFIYILKKFFGIILLAIAVKLFTSNLSAIMDNF